MSDIGLRPTVANWVFADTTHVVESKYNLAGGGWSSSDSCKFQVSIPAIGFDNSLYYRTSRDVCVVTNLHKNRKSGIFNVRPLRHDSSL